MVSEVFQQTVLQLCHARLRKLRLDPGEHLGAETTLQVALKNAVNQTPHFSLLLQVILDLSTHVKEAIVEEGGGPGVREKLNDVWNIIALPANIQVIEESCTQAYKGPQRLHLQLFATNVCDRIYLVEAVDRQPAEVPVPVIRVQRVRHDDLVLVTGHPSTTTGGDSVVVQVTRKEAALCNGHVEVWEQLRRVLLRAVLRKVRRRGNVTIDRIKDAEKCLGEFRTHLATVEPVVPQVTDGVLSLETSTELAQRTRPEDGGISRFETVIYNEPSIVHEAVSVNRVENIWINIM
mmetsp:Transcript_39762/g.105321  ORF Transcript_39762/g.105321 Transcript_39762/m.105321 type:complete len:292 (+) Transcript_39762:175-1050(+)